jgi:hypothetical protein
LKYPPVRRVVAALIGAVFAVYGFIAVLIAIPHAALLPTIVATAAIVGGVTAVLGFWWSKHLLYFASIAYASSLAMNLLGLIGSGWIGDSMQDYVSAVAPSVAVVCALLLSSHLVGRLLRSDR